MVPFKIMCLKVVKFKTYNFHNSRLYASSCIWSHVFVSRGRNQKTHNFYDDPKQTLQESIESQTPPTHLRGDPDITCSPLWGLSKIWMKITLSQYRAHFQICSGTRAVWVDLLSLRRQPLTRLRSSRMLCYPGNICRITIYHCSGI